MPRLIMISQIVENYGSPDEPYWKFKGTDEYVYSGVQEDEIEFAYEKALEEIEIEDPMYREYVISAFHEE